MDKAICKYLSPLKSCVGSLFELSTLMFDLMKWNENSEYSELIPTLQKHFTKDYTIVQYSGWYERSYKKGKCYVEEEEITIY